MLSKDGLQRILKKIGQKNCFGKILKKSTYFGRKRVFERLKKHTYFGSEDSL